MSKDKLLLEGIRVIDAASFIAGPAAATIMSDYGADVIKIEPPEIGDSLRWLIARAGLPEAQEDYCWQLTSRNKRSLSLNLKDSKAHNILRKLVKSADVFITNMPFPIRKELKITSTHIRPLNKKLIYASLTGYGEVGPDCDRTAYDAMAWWARSGLMDWVRPSALSQPGHSTPGMGDQPTAVALYSAIMSALYRREKTGKGAEVTTSLMANGAWSNGILIQAALMDAALPDRLDPPPRHPFGSVYKTRDAREIIFAMVNALKEWPKLARGLGREDWLEDKRFNSIEGLIENSEELRKELSEEIITRDLEDLNASLRNTGTTFGVLSKLSDYRSDEQFLETETLIEMNHERMPGLMTINSPINISDEKKKQPYRAPTIGEHTQEILGELGFNRTAQNNLKETGAVYWE